MAKQKLGFEKSIERLEEIIKLLEQGDAPLDNALSLFEEGAGLLARCGELLDQAEQKVLLLSKGADGAPAERPFIAVSQPGKNEDTAQ
ncbi:MAG: exodeoxyribonuclease VII small subunit [Oscillospiraceae bacterium]|nr:exodeoxyribonuclease VII small subunit [Oscillospiraceae bacterium]